MKRTGIRGRKEKLAAVVLSRHNYGEADLIVTFLTREQGLISALARFGRRSIRRFGGGKLSPGAVAWYDFTFKPEATLAFVENSEDSPKAPRLPNDPLILSLADYALELVRGFEAPGNPARESFNLLVKHLARLTKSQDKRQARLVALDFALKYLELAGFGPRLTGCLLCGSLPWESEIGWRWDPLAGGLYCPDCLAREKKMGRLISPTLLARLAPKEEDRTCPPLSDQDMYEAELFFEKLAEHHLSRSLKSMKVARQLF